MGRVMIMRVVIGMNRVVCLSRHGFASFITGANDGAGY